MCRALRNVQNVRKFAVDEEPSCASVEEKWNRWTNGRHIQNCANEDEMCAKWRTVQKVEEAFNKLRNVYQTMKHAKGEICKRVRKYAKDNSN